MHIKYKHNLHSPHSHCPSQSSPLSEPSPWPCLRFPFFSERMFLKMAVYKYEQSEDESPSFWVDSLFCEEERWEEEDEADECLAQESCLFACGFLEGDLFWEDEELLCMLGKEKEQQSQTHLATFAIDPILSAARSVAVEWMLKVKSHYGFSHLTAILAVAYLDRFLSSCLFQKEKPWMTQLVAVACISLAAKVEEIQVPLLPDLQVEEAKYVFEAKTIQRMELLILSTLQWRMHLVTPYSFLDHIVRRLGFKTNLHLEFFKRSEQLLLSLLSDSRFVGFLPSVLATATMMEVIEQIEPNTPSQYQDQLLNVLKMSKEKVQCCNDLIKEHSRIHCNSPHKRKLELSHGSPSGVIDAGFTSDSSNDSSPSPSPTEPSFKKSKTEEPKMKIHPLKRVFVEIVGSPS